MTMKPFIGTKLLLATAMTRGAWCEYRGWTVPADENPEDDGFMVEYTDGGKPNMEGHDGYVSWSPQEVFEAAYQPLNAMSFGHAIVMLKAGKRVARAGWNGKGMWLVLVPGTPTAQLREGTPYREATGLESCEILPHIDMWTINADGRRAMLPGWLASQSDMLADDWTVIED
jgi:hypothetical protein